MKARLLTAALLVGAPAMLAACGNVVIDVAPAGGDQGAASSGSAGSGGASVSTTTGAGGGAAAPCLGGGKVLYLDGDPGDPVHVGQETIQGAAWKWTVQASPVPSSSRVAFSVQNGNDIWGLLFASDQLAGMPPLAAQIYPDAANNDAVPGHPGLLVVGTMGIANCALNGQFQIETVSAGYAVTAFTATFEQYCDVAGPVLRGCVHYEQ